jgi:phage repressor protein C with HTH and peptisase S24 domain
MTGGRFDAGRLRERLATLGLSQSELARRIDVSQATIAKLALGNAFGTTHLHRIARELGTTPEYLTGETDDAGQGALPVPTPALIADQLGLAMIPHLELGYSMGGGNVISDYPRVGVMPFFRDWLRPMMKGTFADLFVARGEGDSMVPTLMDGDLILIDMAQKAITQQDRLWALSYGDLGMIKRVRKLPDGGYQINSDNPAVTAMTAYDGEMHVVGRVIWIGRRV